MSSADLISRFESSGKIKGKYEKSVPIGGVFKVKHDERSELNPTIPTIRPIDAKCQAQDGSLWLIMAQSTLDYSVLGQLLTYDFLYKEAHTHEKPPRKALVCEKCDDQVVWLCSKLGIDVYEVGKEGTSRVEARLLQ
jgi:hypothetical protein